MKLGELRGLIRKTKGNPLIVVRFGSTALKLPVQKTPLLEQLEVAFPGGKSIETGLTFDDRIGFLEAEGSRAPVPEPTFVQDADLDIDLDLDLDLDAGAASEDDDLLV